MLEKFIAFQLFLAAKRDEEKGATAVEYGLMVALIAVVIIFAVTTLGQNISDMFESVAGKIKSAS